jgi:hypothetical protein
MLPERVRDDDYKLVYLSYRACLPKGLDGLLVTGKAFSATKDAASYGRMVPDIQNLGYSVGLAAAAVVKSGCSIREVDAVALARHAEELGLVPGAAAAETVEYSNYYDYRNLTKLVDKLGEGDLRAFETVACLRGQNRSNIQNLLRDKYSSISRISSSEVRSAGLPAILEEPLLEMAMAWYGMPEGARRLIDELDKLVKMEAPGTSYDDRKPISDTGTPLMGYYDEPDLYWKINRLIVLLGMARIQEAVETVVKLAMQAESCAPPRNYQRIEFRRIPTYERFLSISFCLERIPAAEAIPALEHLLSREYVSGLVSRSDVTAGFANTSAYLEMAIARALARCGGIKGFEVLITYLEDVQSLMAEHALDELKDITGADFEFDIAKWRTWLKSKSTFEVKPLKDIQYMD